MTATTGRASILIFDSYEPVAPCSDQGIVPPSLGVHAQSFDGEDEFVVRIGNHAARMTELARVPILERMV